MKKIMFNDEYGLTKAVLEGRKTQTRRIIKTKSSVRLDLGKRLDDGSVIKNNKNYSFKQISRK